MPKRDWADLKGTKMPKPEWLATAAVRRALVDRVNHRCWAGISEEDADRAVREAAERGVEEVAVGLLKREPMPAPPDPEAPRKGKKKAADPRQMSLI